MVWPSDGVQGSVEEQTVHNGLQRIAQVARPWETLKLMGALQRPAEVIPTDFSRDMCYL